MSLGPLSSISRAAGGGIYLSWVVNVTSCEPLGGYLASIRGYLEIIWGLSLGSLLPSCGHLTSDQITTEWAGGNISVKLFFYQHKLMCVLPSFGAVVERQGPSALSAPPDAGCDPETKPLVAIEMY